MDQSNSPPQGSQQSAEQPQQPAVPQNAKLTKVGEHQLTNGERVLFNEIYAAFDRQRQLIAMLMAEKHGYPEKEPIAFEFNWQSGTVIAYRPSSIEVAGGEPPKPAENKAA